MEKPGRQREHEPAIAVARHGPETGLVAIYRAYRGVNDCRLVPSGEDKPGPAPLEDDNPNNVRCRQPDRELHRQAVGYAMRAQPADIGNRIFRAIAFRFDAEAPLVERRPFTGVDEPPLVDDRLLPRWEVNPRRWAQSAAGRALRDR